MPIPAIKRPAIYCEMPNVEVCTILPMISNTRPVTIEPFRPRKLLRKIKSAAPVKHPRFHVPTIAPVKDVNRRSKTLKIRVCMRTGGTSNLGLCDEPRKLFIKSLHDYKAANVALAIAESAVCRQRVVVRVAKVLVLHEAEPSGQTNGSSQRRTTHAQIMSVLHGDVVRLYLVLHDGAIGWSLVWQGFEAGLLRRHVGRPGIQGDE